MMINYVDVPVFLDYKVCIESRVSCMIPSLNELREPHQMLWLSATSSCSSTNNSVEWAIHCISILNISAISKEFLGAIPTGNISTLSILDINHCNVVQTKKKAFGDRCSTLLVYANCASCKLLRNVAGNCMVRCNRCKHHFFCYYASLETIFWRA